VMAFIFVRFDKPAPDASLPPTSPP
jgi:hypothetical protein